MVTRRDNFIVIIQKNVIKSNILILKTSNTKQDSRVRNKEQWIYKTVSISNYLNVNGLSSLIKRQRVAECINKIRSNNKLPVREILSL